MATDRRDGARAALEAAAAAGVAVCFANPGTTELPLVRALDRVPAIRPVLCLHENVATGAADGYGRLAERPALALLHTGPGLANGMANLHNARKGRSPVVTLVGDHASWHRPADPPLAMAVEAAARTVADAVLTVRRAEDAPFWMAEAVALARGAGGRVVAVVFPHDHQLAATDATADPRPPEPLRPVREEPVARAAAALRAARRPLLLLDGAGLHGAGLAAAGRVAAATGATLAAPTGFRRLRTGRGLPPLVRVPYFPERAQEFFDAFDLVVLAGARDPVAFFGLPDRPSRFLASHPGRLPLAAPGDDVTAALEALADALAAPPAVAAPAVEPPPAPTGSLDPERLAAACARAVAAEGVVVLTAVSSSWPFSRLAAAAAPHEEIALTGGVVGAGSALAVGAALARPGVRVLHLEADGSLAYLPAALWTQAREGLPVTTVVCANRRYRILELELARAGTSPGPATRALTRLEDPAPDWVAVARGFGVPGVRVETAEDLAAALARAAADDGPFLIEALLP